MPREVTVLRRLPPHPNVAQLLDHQRSIDGKTHNIVMEACPGGELYSQVRPPRSPSGVCAPGGVSLSP